MKLRYSPTSPYVRKVMVAAIETGLEDQIEIVPTDPWDSDTDLPAFPVIPMPFGYGHAGIYGFPVISM